MKTLTYVERGDEITASVRRLYGDDAYIAGISQMFYPGEGWKDHDTCWRNASNDAPYPGLETALEAGAEVIQLTVAFYKQGQPSRHPDYSIRNTTSGPYDSRFNISAAVQIYWGTLGFYPVATGGGCDYMVCSFPEFPEQLVLSLTDDGSSPVTLDDEVELVLFKDDHWYDGKSKKFKNSYEAKKFLVGLADKKGELSIAMVVAGFGDGKAVQCG